MKEKSEALKQTERFTNHRDRRIQEIKERRKNHKGMVTGAPGRNKEKK